MPFSLKHNFVSAQAEGSDPTLLQPSNWNEEHAIGGELPVANGGTGAATAEDARTNLGLPTALTAEMEAGTEADLRAMSPALVAAAIAALAAAGVTQTVGTWAPAWTSSGTPPVIGNGILSGWYVKTGRLVVASLQLDIGSTTTIGTGNYSFDFPAPPGASSGRGNGIGRFTDSSTGISYLLHMVVPAGATSRTLNLDNSTAVLGATTPVTVASGDSLNYTISYFTDS